MSFHFCPLCNPVIGVLTESGNRCWVYSVSPKSTCVFSPTGEHPSIAFEINRNNFLPGDYQELQGVDQRLSHFWPADTRVWVGLIQMLGSSRQPWQLLSAQAPITQGQAEPLRSRSPACFRVHWPQTTHIVGPASHWARHLGVVHLI